MSKVDGSTTARTGTGPQPDERSAPEEVIYAQISGAIIEHQLLPGMRLREEALCEVFAVSRPRIRAVLQRLAHDRLVEIQVNRGATVAQPSISEAHQVFEARRIIEPELVSQLARKISSRQVRELSRLVDEEARERKGENRRALIRLSGEFHIRIAEMVENDVLTEFIRELVARTSLIIALYERPGALVCGTDDHMKLVQLLETGNWEKAATFVETHLTAIESGLSLSTWNPATADLRDIFHTDK